MLPDMDQPILEALRLPESEPEKFTLEDQDVECVLCDDKFSVSGSGFISTGLKSSANKEPLLEHLLLKHNFVIGDVHLVANLPEYIRYWKNKFLRQPLARYCACITASVKDLAKCSGATLDLLAGGAGGGGQQQLGQDQHSDGEERQEFYLLSDITSEDREIRQKLHHDRLEKVIRIHETENQSTDFSRSCLFCRQEFSSHASLFDHMAFDHNFNVGQPANLVFVNKFLDVLQNKLENLICLYCEKVFKSRDVLKEHMRKKGHKKLNPQNKEYDAFYIVNYLEFGRTWEDISKDPAEDEVTSGFDVEKDDNHEWGNWRDGVGNLTCLFCPANYPDNSQLFHHMVQIHGFDFQNLKEEMKLSFYQQVKMINYIRRCVHLNTCLGCGENFACRERLMEHMSWSNHVAPRTEDWNQPQFLFPTYENDNLLHCLDEEEDDSPETSEAVVVPEPVNPTVYTSILQDENVRKSLMKRNY